MFVKDQVRQPIRDGDNLSRNVTIMARSCENQRERDGSCSCACNVHCSTIQSVRRAASLLPPEPTRSTPNSSYLRPNKWIS